MWHVTPNKPCFDWAPVPLPSSGIISHTPNIKVVIEGILLAGRPKVTHGLNMSAWNYLSVKLLHYNISTYLEQKSIYSGKQAVMPCVLLHKA